MFLLLLFFFTASHPPAGSLIVSHLIREVVHSVQGRVDHQHGVDQWLVLQLGHGEDPVVQPGAGAGPEGFL